VTTVFGHRVTHTHASLCSNWLNTGLTDGISRS